MSDHDAPADPVIDNDDVLDKPPPLRLQPFSEPHHDGSDFDLHDPEAWHQEYRFRVLSPSGDVLGLSIGWVTEGGRNEAMALLAAGTYEILDA